MLKQSDILKAVRAELKRHYPSTPVYLNEATEGAAIPAFVIELVTTASPDGCRTLNICTLHINYIDQPRKQNALALYDIRDQINASFAHGFQVADRYIHVSSVASSITTDEANMVQTDIPFQYYDAPEEQQPEWLIEHIYNNIHS
ncbi:hypothetical protein SELR_pSRC500270 (plasmid) [Selenomonas ruminantium subsp. lactilytica TAM6421]|uniref:Phage protein n=1 Tax=Selenomonas ruminantium subsp. lactilytica (strain NBRC 103574 / TAM6421) TaxID=927704 RepID=I0GWR4_SELRL|nr:hypothetical protein [Selenomonas ruminantium]BAL85201.1 hypothetical protein SELR_pSRC500270 [Selenomonas ruminantium subsp. lactilytica TAM6421]